MRKKQYIQRRHKYFVLLVLEIIGAWILTVLVIQYCTSTQQPVKNTIPISRFVRPRQKEQTVNIPWNLILINHENYVPDGFRPDLTTLNNGCQVDRRILPDLQRMMDAARKRGLYPSVCSAYRTEERQTYLLERDINKYLNQGCTELRPGRRHPDGLRFRVGVSIRQDWLWISWQLIIRCLMRLRKRGKNSSGLWKTAGNTDLLSDIQRIKQILQKSDMNRGITGMWERKPQGK